MKFFKNLKGKKKRRVDERIKFFESLHWDGLDEAGKTH